MLAEVPYMIDGLRVTATNRVRVHEEFRDFVVEWFRKTGTRFDQILLERNKTTGAKWIHIGLYNNAGQQRGQIKVMEV